MTRKKQTNLSWYVTGALSAAVLVIILSLCNRWKPPGNADIRDGNFRIVSLAPNVTEMLFALDLEDSVIGVTDRCDWPDEAKDLECVGGFGRPNIEKLLALHPKLVIATDFERNDTAEMLSSSGICVLELRIRSFAEMFEAMRKIGQVTEKSRRAEELIEAMRGKLKMTADRFKETATSKRPRVFVELWYDPITTVGGTSFIDEVIRRAGGINVAHNISQAYPRINPEKVIEWNPDVIVLCYMAGQRDCASQLAGRIGWADISAVRNGRIIGDIPSDFILRPGPRLIEGVEILAQHLYGTAVEKRAASNKKDGLTLAEKVQQSR